jgi:CHAD domain-containing protein
MASGATKKLRGEVKDLRGQLKQERGLGAEALVAMLEGSALKLEPRLEELMDGLEPVAEVGMSAVDLEVLTRGWYESQRSAAEREAKPNDQLHGIRKAAKLARYMAENGLAERVVKEFEALQDAGGQWHDYVDLGETARRRLGKGSRLEDLLKKQEAQAMSRFQGLTGN